MEEFSIKEKRKELGMTQKELAENVGVSLSTIKRLEKYGIKDSGDTTVNRILKVFDTTTEEEVKRFIKFSEEYVKENKKTMIMFYKDFNTLSGYISSGPHILLEAEINEVYHVYMYSGDIGIFGYKKELDIEYFVSYKEKEEEIKEKYNKSRGERK